MRSRTATNNANFFLPETNVVELRFIPHFFVTKKAKKNLQYNSVVRNFRLPVLLTYFKMHKFFHVFLIGALFSCNRNDSTNVPTDNLIKSDILELKDNSSNEVIKVDPEAITKDFMTWYNYAYYKIHLSQNFIGLDTDSVKIDKLTFLKKLQSGSELPFEIKIFQGRPVYRLYKVNSTDESIIATIKQIASTEIAHLKMEGIEMPDFNFTDINGNHYNKSSIKEKLVVLNCWFVHCTTCVQEFPELNKFVDENKNVPNILFVSLAMDSKQDLQNFLKTKEFKYAVVPLMKNYMLDKLGITIYPTHLLVNSKGIIIKVVNRIEDLVPFFDVEKSKI